MANSELPPEDKPKIGPDLPGIKEQESNAGTSNKGQDGGGLYNPKGDEGKGQGSSSGALSSSALSGAEKGQDKGSAALPGERLGAGYNPESPLSKGAKVKGFLKKRKKGAMIGGGLTGMLVALIVGGLLILIPLKIEHVVQNLEKRFFATSENAVSKETHKMMISWLRQVGTAMRLGNCAKEGNYVISKDCTIHVSGNGRNPVYNLYRTWSDAKLENEFADKFGIELKYDTRGPGTFYLRAPGMSKDAIVGNGSAGLDARFTAVERRNTVRAAFTSSIKDMTLWNKIMYRYKVGRLLEEKYGIKRCIVFCGVRDAFADKVKAKKYAAKAFLIERVIEPKNAALAAVMGCLFNTSANACTSQQPTSCSSPPCDELAGEAQTQADGDVSKAVGSVTSSFGAETASKLMGQIQNIRDKGGPQKYLLDKLISQVFSQDIADKSVPVVGELQTIAQASNIIQKLANAPAAIKKLSFLANSAGAVSLYMMYRTYADEIHTGHADPTETGSFYKSLGSGDQCQSAVEGSCTTQKGGDASAENAPLYDNVINNDTSAVNPAATSMLDGILPSTAYAAATQPSTQSTYKCDNGHTISSGQMVCPEEKLGQSNGIINAISSALNATGLAGLASTFNSIINSFPISTILGALNSITNFFSSALETVAENTPGVSNIINAAKSLTGNFINFLTNQLIPQPMSQDMSGGRTFDMMSAGADVSGNDYAHDGLGGKLLTDNQVSQIVAEQNSQDQQQFASESLVARLFDTNSQYSLVSKVAMDLPFDFQSTSINSFSSLISNPLQALNHSFASLFTGKASAAASPLKQCKIFGVNCYGYTQSDLNAIGDDGSYWDNHCTSDPSQGYQTSNAYNTAASNSQSPSQYSDPNSFINSPQDPSGMPVNTQTNPCLLIEAVTGSAGGAFNSDMLTQGDLADANGSGGAGGGGSGPVSNSCTGGGKYSALVGSGSNFAGVDQGIDFTPASSSGYKICAPAPGEITLADQTGHHFDRTTGQAEVIEKLDQKPSAPNSSQYIYYAELIQIDGGIHANTTHVNAGDLIGTNNQNPGIEVGWGQSPSMGFMCPIGIPTPCGASFNTWVQGLSSGHP